MNQIQTIEYNGRILKSTTGYWNQQQDIEINNRILKSTTGYWKKSGYSTENLPSGGKYIISKMNGKSIKSNFNYKYRALMLICAIWMYLAGDLENSIHS